MVELDFELQPARPEDPQRAAREIETLENITAASNASAAQQVVDILSPAASGEEKDVVRACCLALLRLMQEQKGFFGVIKASAMECLHAIKETIVPEEEDMPAVFEQEVRVVRDEASKKAAAYIENVDHIDFHELPQVLLLVAKLHRESELVCRKGFVTLMRFASYDTEHRKQIMPPMVPVIAYVLKNFIEPLLLRQSLHSLCRLFPGPFGKDAAALVLADEDFLPAVINVLKDHPADMGMQLNGFRLLTVWSRASIELRQEVLNSAAPGLLQTHHKTISDAGLDHIGSWLWAIAGRSLMDDVDADCSHMKSKEDEDAARKAKKDNRKSVGQPSRKTTTK